MVKRQIVLRVVEEEQNVVMESYEIDARNLFYWNDVLGNIFGSQLKVTNKTCMKILNESSDQYLVCLALATITSKLTNKQLEKLLIKFEGSERVQKAIVFYSAGKKNVSLLRKLAMEGVTEKVRQEAKAFFL